MSIVKNKKAYYEYHILDEYDAGVVLIGSEVKSVREGNVTFSDSFIYLKDGEVWLKNFKVGRYKQNHPSVKHDENRDKKLLLTRKEIERIGKKLQDKGTTCIPLSVFTKKNKIKIKIGVAKGKKLWDKKETIKKRDIQRELRKDMNINI